MPAVAVAVGMLAAQTQLAVLVAVVLVVVQVLLVHQILAVVVARVQKRLIELVKLAAQALSLFVTPTLLPTLQTLAAA